MTNPVEDVKVEKPASASAVVVPPPPSSEAFQNGENSSSSSSAGSDSDAVKSSSISSVSSVASSSSGTTSKLALRMADQVSLSSSPAEKRFKFEPNEDYLDQLLAMGISINGAKKVCFLIKF